MITEELRARGHQSIFQVPDDLIATAFAEAA